MADNPFLIRKIRGANRIIREDGVGALVKMLWRIVADHAIETRLRTQIFLRGRNRVLTIDGCRFDLSPIPDTRMKLELQTGRYELPEREAVRRFVRAGWPVVELGGCVGVVSCITNKLLQNPTAHVVLEANPLVIPHLTSNRKENGCSFKILNKALSYDADSVTFAPSRDFWGNSLLHNGTHDPVTVASTQLRTILEEEHFETFALICDIEGLEYDLVMREMEALNKAELIIMEVHPHMLGEEKVRELLSRLADNGFKTLDRSGLVVVLGKA